MNRPTFWWKATRAGAAWILGLTEVLGRFLVLVSILGFGALSIVLTHRRGWAVIVVVALVILAIEMEGAYVTYCAGVDSTSVRMAEHEQPQPRDPSFVFLNVVNQNYYRNEAILPEPPTVADVGDPGPSRADDAFVLQQVVRAVDAVVIQEVPPAGDADERTPMG